MAKVSMSVTIDTECDKSLNWQNSNPLTFKSVLKGIPEILQPLFKKYGIKPTYFLSPEVIENDECIKVLKQFNEDCELGTHLHSDFIDPQKTKKKMEGYQADAFQTEYEADIEFEKLKNLTNLFSSKFGYDPKVFRAGRYSANSNTMNSLLKLSYKVDSSFTPHHSWRGPKGSLIDHSKSPDQPYFLNPKEVYSRGESSLLEVPISITKSKFSFFGQKTIWLRPKFSSFREIKKLIHTFKKNYVNLENVFLVMMFHSQEVIPCASPYTRTDKEVQDYVKTLDQVFEYSSKLDVEFLTLEEVYTRVLDD